MRLPQRVMMKVIILTVGCQQQALWWSTNKTLLSVRHVFESIMIVISRPFHACNWKFIKTTNFAPLPGLIGFLKLYVSRGEKISKFSQRLSYNLGSLGGLEPGAWPTGGFIITVWDRQIGWFNIEIFRSQYGSDWSFWYEPRLDGSEMSELMDGTMLLWWKL